MRRSRWRTLAIAVLGLALPAAADELVVGAAVSLKRPLSRIVARYEATHPGTKLRLGFGASSFLAQQIRSGAPIEVFLSADALIVDRLVSEGLVAPEGRAELATNRLVVLVRSDASVTPERPDALLDPTLRRIAVPDGAVPVGRYARQWLTSRGLLARLEPRLVRTEHARASLAAVDLGHADATIVYATDARLARSARLAFEVPAEEQPRIVYAAALLGKSGADARDFFAFVTGPESHEALVEAGFGIGRPGTSPGETAPP